MRKICVSLIAVSMLFSPAGGLFGDRLDRLNDETDSLWRRGKGAEDGAFTSIASSMLAWGIGIGAVAIILAILIKSSASSSSH